MRKIIICCDGTWNEPDQASKKYNVRKPTNIVKITRTLKPLSDDRSSQILLEASFDMSENLIGTKNNTSKTKKEFDQIAYISDSKKIRGTGLVDAYNFYDIVYKDEDQKIYEVEIIKCLKGKSGIPYLDRGDKGQERYYKQHWRTHMMSDHLPIWVEIKTNFSTEYLDGRAFL